MNQLPKTLVAALSGSLAYWVGYVVLTKLLTSSKSDLGETRVLHSVISGFVTYGVLRLLDGDPFTPIPFKALASTLLILIAAVYALPVVYDAMRLVPPDKELTISNLISFVGALTGAILYSRQRTRK